VKVFTPATAHTCDSTNSTPSVDEGRRSKQGDPSASERNVHSTHRCLGKKGMHVSHHDMNILLHSGSRLSHPQDTETRHQSGALQGSGVDNRKVANVNIRARGVVRSERKVRSSSGLRCRVCTIVVSSRRFIHTQTHTHTTRGAERRNCRLITSPRPVSYAIVASCSYDHVDVSPTQRDCESKVDLILRYHATRVLSCGTVTGDHFGPK
jgi:hypothetical protein